MPRKTTQDEFISKSQKIHAEKNYDYSLVNYINTRINVTIICPIHGEFQISPYWHLKGSGCQKCTVKRTHDALRSDTETFIYKSKQIHGDKFDYNLVNYINTNEKVKIICPVHGIFEQIPKSHQKGLGCAKCSASKRAGLTRSNNSEFIERAKKIHGNETYDYSLVVYETCNSDVIIICKTHGAFKQTPKSHMSGHRCPRCASTNPKAEEDIRLFLIQHNIIFDAKCRDVITPFELDFYIPSHNLAIEYNGLYWHCEAYRTNDYHFNKTILCENQNINLIHLFEDEWLYKQEIVKSKLKEIFDLFDSEINAENCEIRYVDLENTQLFLNENHLEGCLNSDINIGLYCDDRLVSLLCFNGYNNEYELIKYCNKINTKINDSFDLLLTNFIKDYSPSKIICNVSRRWGDNVCEKLNFKLIGYTEPTYWYRLEKIRKDKSNFTIDKLIAEGYDPNKSEHEIMLNRKIYRIYDCGMKKYELNIK